MSTYKIEKLDTKNAGPMRPASIFSNIQLSNLRLTMMITLYSQNPFTVDENDFSTIAEIWEFLTQVFYDTNISGVTPWHNPFNISNKYILYMLSLRKQDFGSFFNISNTK